MTVGVIGAVRRELAQARRAARAGHSAAAALRQAAEARLESVRKSAPTRRLILAAQRDEAWQQAEARFSREAEALTASLARLASAAAPGLAGIPFHAWHPDGVSNVDGSGGEVGLWRIGAAGTFPALVPLLGEAHLTVEGPRQTVDSLIGGLLLRMLACTPPGSLRITVYDPGGWGGALAGLAPLSAAGLVSYRGPGGLTPFLNELVEARRDLADLAARTGRRPEPWRIAVLLADGIAEITAAQRAQLDRLARTGAAAGIHLIASGIGIGGSEWIRIEPDGTALTSLTGETVITLDSPPPHSLVTAVCKSLAASSGGALRACVGEGAL